MSRPSAPPASPSVKLPRDERLRKRPDYLRVQASGRKLQTPSFLVFVSRTPSSGPTRFGVTVTRKIGGAVVRNRIKRLVREVVRVHKMWFPPGRELVFVAKRGAAALCYHDLERELETLCSRYFVT